MADRGLRHMQLVGRLLEAAVARGGLEGAHGRKGRQLPFHAR
jgi:hypothetical protein